jgi:hypothetical protein
MHYWKTLRCSAGWTGFLIVIFFGCNSRHEKPAAFKVLNSKQTGLEFTNKLTSTDSFNLFEYMYFYNGAGIGAGDFNSDGLTDLFFSSNQGANTLYLNTGKLHFKDVSVAAKIPTEDAWNTGVSVVDINSDGLLDIYICRVGKYEILKSHNQLLVCQGIDKNGTPFYADKAREFGLDFSGFSSQAAFFDYDLDGDLDMFLLNHSIHEKGNYSPRKDFAGSYHPLSGDRMYRNDGARFSDVTRESQINSSAISYGLGVVVADINLDGYPDLYVGNDFHENDYLYINQKDGTFKEDLNEQIMHTSRFSMGVDAADVTNDGFPEIISVDMLPSDPLVLKRSLGEDEYDIFNQKIEFGYNYQYSRNSLQYNRRNGMFSEVGFYTKVAATDWSWAPLWVDFDNDGLKDLFVSNGIPKRMNDIDYINFISSQEVQQKIQDNKMNETDAILIDKFPKIKIPNKFFKNNGDLKFEDVGESIGDDQATYSNGAVYADLDNDGDLDIVVNNIDEPALVYENTNSDFNKTRSLNIKIKGPDRNPDALGSKAVVFANNGVRVYEKFPVHGFLSSMETPLQIGLTNTRVDSIFFIWPDGTFQPVNLSKDTAAVSITYQKNLPAFDYRKITSFKKFGSFPVADITATIGLNFRHIENPYREFDQEPLLPHMFSTEGPALAVADVNHDGTEDIFIGSSKGQKSAVFTQNNSGGFTKITVPAIDNDSTYEDVSAIWADINNDGNEDLIVASGGNEQVGKESFLAPRIYMNDGRLHFTVLNNAFDHIHVNASGIVATDFNNDGYLDLFLTGRTVPWSYGEIPRSYLLQNDKNGKFTDVTSLYAKELLNIGFVTNSVLNDIDKDGDQDLLLSLEWGGIVAFINDKGTFIKRILTDKMGWWNFVTPADLDNDGDIDLIAGNLGLNSRLKASEKEQVNLYYNDFDGNGKNEQVMTYYVNGREIPFSSKAELEKQIPLLKKKFLYAKDFAKASLNDIFSQQKLDEARRLSANYFSNSILINDGKMNFTVRPMPWEAQFSSYKDAVIVNANGDDLPDILVVGNYYENNIEMGRSDADFGTLLLNRGNGSFACESLNGFKVKGQVRRVGKMKIQKKDAYILARNNDSTLVIRFQGNNK